MKTYLSHGAGPLRTGGRGVSTELCSLLWVVAPGWVFPNHPGSFDEGIPGATPGPAFRSPSDFLSVLWCELLC
jgi:hypothetical protein